ncbi:MAG: glycosyltransferase family 2 protein, partial [Bacteroidales bacterium]|nr:glycosyltransferase family 2 protein [Bacteroidales bacterium]
MNFVSIVILNWNGKEFLRQFLPKLLEHSAVPGVEIVIADNASTDGSLEFLKEEYPEIRVVIHDRNYGFSGGYNRAFEELESKYYLLLNSDIEVTPGWLSPLLERMEEDEQIAACTPKIMDYHNRLQFEYAGAAGGYLDRYGYPFCRGRIFDTLEEDRQQYDDDIEIFWGSGACLLVRSELFSQAGGLDEKFFAHMEEIDLCWRLKRLGYRIEYVARSCVYHVGGGTLPKSNPMKTFLNFRNNLLLLYKNLPKKG